MCELYNVEDGAMRSASVPNLKRTTQCIYKVFQSYFNCIISARILLNKSSFPWLTRKIFNHKVGSDHLPYNALYVEPFNRVFIVQHALYSNRSNCRQLRHRFRLAFFKERATIQY